VAVAAVRVVFYTTQVKLLSVQRRTQSLLALVGRKITPEVIPRLVRVLHTAVAVVTLVVAALAAAADTRV
jgi:hypothetical protein